MQQVFTVGSLFAGIGGLDDGLERTGRFQVVWQVEIDPYCQRVLATHWPNVTRFRDVREVGAHNLSPVDVLAGGFPCQPHSLAGKRRASADERDLWGEFARLLRQLRPRYVLAENVPGLCSSESGRFFGRVLRDLAACGYDAEWQVLSAAAFGAPHLRERVFIVAYPNGDRQWQWSHQHEYQPPGDAASNVSNDGSKEPLADSTRNGWESRRTERKGLSGELRFERRGASLADADRQGLAVGQVFGEDARTQLAAIERESRAGAGQWATEPAICRVVNGVPHRVDRLRGLGNAVVPHIAEYIGRCMLARAERSLEKEEG